MHRRFPCPKDSTGPVSLVMSNKSGCSNRSGSRVSQCIENVVVTRQHPVALRAVVNIGECRQGDHATMTLMVLGDECTRRCRFCAVKTVQAAAPPDPDEPEHVGRAVGELHLDYVVITDFGASNT